MSKVFELRENQVLHTYVFEKLGQPEKEREFKLKELKRWGFDLIFGKKDGQETFFTAEIGTRKKGDVYTERDIQTDADVKFEVYDVIEELPKNKKIFAHIEMIEGIAYLIGELREGDKNIQILHVPAGITLLAYLKKRRLHHIIEALRNVGTSLELVKQRGQEGRAKPYDQMPPLIRRFLREARDVEEDAGFGRIAVAYFGENKDGEPRFRISWFLPTISLFDLSIAEKTDKLLGALD